MACSSLKTSILRENISLKKVYVWIYTFHKKELVGLFVKEKFRNYELINGYIHPSDNDCYEITLRRILNENHIHVDHEQFRKIFYFTGVPIIKKHLDSMIVIGIYKNIQINAIKKNIKNTFGILENATFFNLHGENVAYSQKRFSNELSITSKNIINKSIDEDWINIYKINAI